MVFSPFKNTTFYERKQWVLINRKEVLADKKEVLADYADFLADLKNNFSPK